MSKYDYSKFKDNDSIDMEKMEYWGLHEVDDRIEIDIERYEKACRMVPADEMVPMMLRGKKEYYVPSKRSRYDYASNYLLDCLDGLKDDWNEEYRPLFDSIRSPKEAEDGYRISTIAMFGNSDTFESIDLGSKLARIRRIWKYERVIEELHCIFIMKVCAEMDRMLLRALSMRLYENNEFSIQNFISYCNGMNKDVRVTALEGWRSFSKLHDINNFLKHNSRKSYEILKKFHPECVYEGVEAEYENGMFAFNWIILKEADIETFLEDMRTFLREFSKGIMGEDLERASWDYDDYFIDAFNEMKDPLEYLGIYGAVGMSDWDRSMDWMESIGIETSHQKHRSGSYSSSTLFA